MEDLDRPLHTSSRAYLWATIVLVALLIASLIFYFLASGERLSTTNEATNSNGDGNGAAISYTAPPATPEPDTMYVRAGTVTRVSTNAVRFDASVYNEKKGVYEKKELTADISDSTHFIEVDRTTLPVAPVPGQSGAVEPAPKDIRREDVRLGDTVEIVADTNIKGKTSFAAKEVRRILTQ